MVSRCVEVCGGVWCSLIIYVRWNTLFTRPWSAGSPPSAYQSHQTLWGTPFSTVSPLPVQQLWVFHFSKPFWRGRMENFWVLSHSSLGGAFSGSLWLSEKFLFFWCCSHVAQGTFVRATTPAEIKQNLWLSHSQHSETCHPDLPSSPWRVSKTPVLFRCTPLHSEITLCSDSLLSRANVICDPYLLCVGQTVCLGLWGFYVINLMSGALCHSLETT